MLTTIECDYAGNFHFLSFSFAHKHNWYFSEIRNNPCGSLKRIIHKTFHASETLQPDERRNQKLFQTFQVLPNAFSFLFSLLKQWKEDVHVAKEKRTFIEDKFRALQETESGQTKSLVAQKYKVLRSTISTWFLPANKDQITTAFSFGAIHFKGNNVKAGKHENLEKAFSK